MYRDRVRMVWENVKRTHSSLPMKRVTLRRLREILRKHFPNHDKAVFWGPYKGAWMELFQKTRHFKEIVPVDASWFYLAPYRPVLDPYSKRRKKQWNSIQDDILHGVWDQYVDKNSIILSYEFTPLTFLDPSHALKALVRLLSFPGSVHIVEGTWKEPHEKMKKALKAIGVNYRVYEMPAMFPDGREAKVKAYIIKPDRDIQRRARILAGLTRSTPLSREVRIEDRKALEMGLKLLNAIKE